jgi:hypothetical protein
VRHESENGVSIDHNILAESQLLIKDLRKQFGSPKMYEWFEYLHNEMQKKEQQRAKV